MENKLRLNGKLLQIMYRTIDIKNYNTAESEMKRIFERKSSIEDSRHEAVIERIKVGVVGIGSGAGASFIGVSLAYFAAQMSERNTAFVQLDGKRERCKTDIYDALGMDKRFAGREFVDFFNLLDDGKSVKHVKNIDENINWALEIPYAMKRKQNGCKEKNDLSEQLKYMRLVNNIDGNFIICDFGADNLMKPGERALYEDTDVIICVIDPLPSRLLGASEQLKFIRSLKIRGHKVITVINKDNPGVNRRELRDFLSYGEGLYTIPMLDEKLIYLCQYNCEIPASHKEIREKTEQIFLKMLKEILYVQK